ncbi:hypothetical protein [Mucilaginibacter sp. FT3.2]|uniref:hypothetical protein n=1 Tax=Mucilaginibacter sp. FT3.2 TaxID=2723090 RepID=UPI00161EB21A|nr:hypothetical protein [Mucilaginibacter sp. FT3.2]MBB6230719.1 hypothetical protein [Mucilaginibacter sp. FT3.2]
MKKIILTAAIFLGCLAIKPASAQISLSINIGSQPEWGPTGYDRADYYYMPDIDSYYDVNAHQYVYFNNNGWIHSAALPPRYANYDVYHGYKVVVNDRTPWVRNNVYRAKYANFKGRRDQTVIRDSREVKYKNHWNDRSATRKAGGRDNHRDDKHDDKGHDRRN